MSPLYTPTRDLALPSSLVRETVITSLSPGAVFDHAGLHNTFRGMEPDPRAITRLHDCLEARDAANELPDGSMPGGRIIPRPKPKPARKPRRPRTTGRPSGRPVVWTSETIHKAIVRWAETMGSPPSRLDWDPSAARKAGHPEFADRFRAGSWPHYMTVKRNVGWTAAIRGAGLEPQRGGGNRRVAA